MIKLLDFFENDSAHKILKIDEFSFVIHNQSIGQKNVQVFLSSCVLTFIIAGKKIIHTGCQEININAGEAFFAQRGTYLTSEKHDLNDCFQSLIIFIDNKFLIEFIDKYSHLITTSNGNKNDSSEIYKINSSELLHSYVQSLFPYLNQEFAYKKELLKLKFEELFFHLINAENFNFLNYLKNIQMTSKIDMNQFMNKNFTMPLTLQEFAHLTYHSLSTFKNEFKKTFNLPPKQWINGKRLERAQTLLTITDKNITEICYEVGFDNLSHFIQLFKKKFGITPKKIRYTKINSSIKN